ncbi:hypothetical protein G6553_20135 [Nocardioides sp. IC4_145]|uniref:hypothetical protein n=1 Tax=Nocardioides sp. IC4_145 TaxID=2714037 RepID=UPI001409F43B|nr:hypothetical protein [Nocardioides sp. IC4_145]NHC25473.1 hypothetical protein [Nocardioides sp. IC4_145]
MTRRRTWIAVVAAVVVAALVVVLWVRDHRREEEWTHGDDVQVGAQVAAARGRVFADAVEAAGGPRRPTLPGPQSVAVRVEWSGSPDPGGWYEFILLDGRLEPARPVPADSAWAPGEETGADWSGAYDALAEHYPWLSGTAERRVAGGWTSDHQALGLRARTDGTGTLVYRLPRAALPTSAPERDLRLAMVHVDADGEVRWAKEVPLERLPVPAAPPSA